MNEAQPVAGECQVDGTVTAAPPAPSQPPATPLAPDPCEWRNGLELLCGANCEGDTRVWCSKYDDDAAACGNAYAQRVNGSYGRCEHSGDACTLEQIYECPSPPPSPLPPWAPNAAPLPSSCANPCGLTLDEDEAADEAPVSKGFGLSLIHI